VPPGTQPSGLKVPAPAWLQTGYYPQAWAPRFVGAIVLAVGDKIASVVQFGPARAGHFKFP